MPEVTTRTIEIRDGIEWFEVVVDGMVTDTDCQCAVCGCSAVYVYCYSCGGEGEHDETDDFEWPGYHRCDTCKGKGGWWVCGDAPCCKGTTRSGRGAPSTEGT